MNAILDLLRAVFSLQDLTFTSDLAVGGLLALYVRSLYLRFGTSISDRAAFGNIFPLLTLTTTLVIVVVKSSLALSLGLVGALSIVRFRSAIKEPEELVYLFFSIAVGLAIGASYRIVALIACVVFTVFVLLQRSYGQRGKRHNLLVTVTGATVDLLEGAERGITNIIREGTQGFRVQRFDSDDDRAELRVVVDMTDLEAITGLMTELRKALPGCSLSYVDLDTLI